MNVLVVSNDDVGSKMAGPGIRSYRFAEELSKQFDVTLSIPRPTDLRLDGIEVVVANPFDTHAMTALTRKFEAVVAQRLPVPTSRALSRSATRTVYDLYTPQTIENLAFDAGRLLDRSQRAFYALNTLAQEASLRYGDAFICASERQRDLWLGALLALGRVDHVSYREQPALRGLIDVVPFGIEPTPPEPGPALRGVVPGIGETSRILLWGGGIWNWFDPLTVIRAVAELRTEGRDVWLVFLGVRRPNPDVPQMEMTQRALELADELGVRDRGVYFNEDWVPYEQRGAYLLDADLGVSAHFDDVETRFAYRTRLLDCFWAGLPVVVTEGDALGELVAERRLGVLVPPEDVGAWKAALGSVLDGRDALRGVEERFDAVRSELAWPRVVEPLARLLQEPAKRAPRRLDATLGRYVAARLENAAASRGVAGSVRRVGAIVAEQVGLRLRRAPGPERRVRSADDE